MAEPINGHEVRSATRETKQMERPALDDREYRVVRLHNQLEALLIHDADTDKVSAALDVNVGSYSDAIDMPGMAHAVEHLLFMGTKKYPVENEYNRYLSAHSGYSNAYTASTSTNYYFEVAASSTPSSSAASTPQASQTNLSASKSESPLYGALDRFAQFFIEPLFLEDTLDRELRAVDSENKKNLQSDNWRLHQLNKSLSNPEHPFCKFSTGNYQTLRDDPLKRGVKIRDEFIKFHETHYSANRMKLVVLGREDLNTLEDWVEELFSEVKNKDLPKLRWDDVSVYGPKELGMQVFAQPVFDVRTLDISFPYQDEEDLYMSQPGRYFSHLIGHEGPGSILAYIKAKGWANGLGAGSLPLCPGGALFSISIRLTEDGLKHYREVAKIVFQYIAMLRETPPQRWIFEELKAMSEVDFKFKQKSQASKTASKLSNTMQRPFPRDLLLSGPEKIREFNSEAIKSGIECLRPDNFRMTLCSRDFPGDWDKNEKWYGTRYKYEPIPQEFMEDIKKVYSNPSERPAELYLPHRNEFIPTRLEVVRKDNVEPMKTPKLVRNEENVRVWYKKDDRFWVPKANVHITLRTPLASMTPRTTVASQLYRELIQDALVEFSYAAEISGLDYNIVNHALGIDVSVSGYNDKMHVLLEKVLLTMRDLTITDERFKIVKDRLLRGFQNWDFQQPYHQVGTYSRWLISDKGWVNEQYLAELPHIDAHDVREFFPQLLKQCHIEMLAHGNLYKEDVLKMADLVNDTLKARTLAPSQWPIRRTLTFPEGSNFVYERQLKDPANVNHCIEYLLYIGNNQDRSLRAKLMLLAQMADEPAFDQLRTKEQLGYVVFSGTCIHNTWAGYRILIQSEKDPSYLEKRIDAFLTGFGKSIEEMSETEFEGHRRSLTNKRLEKLKNLTQETNRFWGHVMSECFDFEQVDHDVANISPLTKSDIQTFFAHYISPTSPHRAKLAVHLLAQSTPATIAANTTPDEQASKLVSMVTEFMTAVGVPADDAQLKKRLDSVKLHGENATKDLVDAIEQYLSVDAKVAAEKVQSILAQGQQVLAAVLPTIGVESKSPPEAATNAEEGPTDGSELEAKANDVEGTDVNGLHVTDGTTTLVNGDAEKITHTENGTKVVRIEDVHAYKASVPVSAGARPVRDLSYFEDAEAKL